MTIAAKIRNKLTYIIRALKANKRKISVIKAILFSAWIQIKIIIRMLIAVIFIKKRVINWIIIIIIIIIIMALAPPPQPIAIIIANA